MKILENIIKLLLGLFKPFLNTIQISEQINLTKSKKLKQVKKFEQEKDNANYLNPSAFTMSKNNFIKNIEAYWRGQHFWENGNYNNKKYNNISYSKRKNDQGIYEYFKIYRHYSNKGFLLAGKKKIEKSEFSKAKKTILSWTWCNVFAGTASLLYCPEIGNIQNHHKKGDIDRRGNKIYEEYSANSVNRNLKKGFYNTENYEFMKCNLEDGIEYANRGGLCFVCFINPTRRGHIAVLTGFRKYIKGKGHPEIIQAGAKCGIMLLKDGFGTALKKYYKLVRKI
jgi:hypothetical protein